MHELVDWLATEGTNRHERPPVLGPQARANRLADWLQRCVLVDPQRARPGWPSNWSKLGPPLAKFYGWSPREIEQLTGSELATWVQAANELIEQQREENADG